jgi:RNA polymerase sigma-70 factor (ECF subfamily)
MMSDQELTVDFVRRALAGDPAALNELLAVITPSIRYSVADTLRRRVRSVVRSRVRHEVADLTQDVLVALLANDGRRLRQWDPERGLSLRRYVEMVARHLVESFLRKRERRFWENEPIDAGGFEELEDGAESPEHAVAHKELFEAVYALVQSELTRQGRELFELLVVDGQSVPDVCARTGMTQNAVHVWRSRLTARVTEAARRIQRGAVADD